MDKTFYMHGVLYLEWTNCGRTYIAVKDQVDFLGKETFEQEGEELCEVLHTDPDRIEWPPIWLSDTDLIRSIKMMYNYMRDQEIM